MQTTINATKGCDPEVFLINPKTGEFISSVGLFGGTKDAPMPIGEGCALQEDNVTVEFNTPPCKTADDFVKAINYNLDTIKKRCVQLGLEMSIKPSAVFSDEQLNTPQAQTFGCEPDYNAWRDGDQNERPHADNPNLRSAGGHIHIEVPEGLDILEVVKAMDWFVGCQMIEFDKDTDRRKLYGKPGAFRKKPYGVEYRTASNAWIADNEKIRWVWAQTDKALAWVAEGKAFTEEQGMMIQMCILNSDEEVFNKLVNELPL